MRGSERTARSFFPPSRWAGGAGGGPLGLPGRLPPLALDSGQGERERRLAGSVTASTAARLRRRREAGRIAGVRRLPHGRPGPVAHPRAPSSLGRPPEGRVATLLRHPLYAEIPGIRGAGRPAGRQFPIFPVSLHSLDTVPASHRRDRRDHKRPSRGAQSLSLKGNKKSGECCISATVAASTGRAAGPLRGARGGRSRSPGSREPAATRWKQSILVLHRPARNFS